MSAKGPIINRRFLIHSRDNLSIVIPNLTAKKDDFDQQTVCKTPVPWLTYTTSHITFTFTFKNCDYLGKT